VKGASSVVEVNVGSRTADRVTFVEAKLAEYRVSADRETVVKITDRLGDDVARVDALARTLQTIYGTAPLNFTHVEPYLGDAGDVPEWDLTDAIDGGDATRPSSSLVACWTPRAVPVCRSSTCCNATICGWPNSKAVVCARPTRPGPSSYQRFPGDQVTADVQRLGTERISTAVHWIADADVALKVASVMAARTSTPTWT